MASEAEISLVGGRLKRLLSCLMVINVIEIGFGGSILSMLGFLWHLIGYIGAHKRNPRMLGAYFFASIAMVFFFIFLLFFSIAAMGYQDPNTSDDSSFASSLASSSEWVPTPHKFTAAYRRLFQATSVSSESSTFSSDNPTPTSSEEIDTGAGILLGILSLVLVFLVAYMKFYSLYLACRMRRMILDATVLPVAIDYQPNQEESETSPLATPVPVENHGAYPFMQPNSFMPAPYPFHMQGAPSVLPPPLMYGQQPVFYTYTPMNFPYPHQQQQQNPQNQPDEKQ